MEVTWLNIELMARIQSYVSLLGKQWSCLPIFYSISFLCLILFSLRKSYNLSSGSGSCSSYLLFIGMRSVLELCISKQSTSVLNFILKYLNTQSLPALLFFYFMMENAELICLYKSRCYLRQQISLTLIGIFKMAYFPQYSHHALEK